MGSAGEQFIEEHAKQIDVVARIHINAGHQGRFGTHAGRRTDELVESGEQGFVRQILLRGPAVTLICPVQNARDVGIGYIAGVNSSCLFGGILRSGAGQGTTGGGFELFSRDDARLSAATVKIIGYNFS